MAKTTSPTKALKAQKTCITVKKRLLKLKCEILSVDFIYWTLFDSYILFKRESELQDDWKRNIAATTVSSICGLQFTILYRNKKNI